MSKASRSGYTVNDTDVPIILGMIARGDRRHDVAAWFGLNQGRIKEVEDGKHGNPAAASSHQLLPSGSPGPKAQELKNAILRAQRLLEGNREEVAEVLSKALRDYDARA